MHGPVEFFRLNYTKADLAAVPEDDVVFFFMMCQLHNDTAALLRIVFANWPRPEFPEPVAVNRATTCFMAIRVLAGRLEEGWKTIKDLFGRSFSNYAMSERASASHQELRIYFSRTNFIRLLRDTVSNHHLREPMRTALREFPDDHEFTDFTSRGLGNTVYWGAENVITANAILLAQSIKPELNRTEALDFVIKDVTRISDHFIAVTSAYCLGFYRQHLPKQLELMKSQREVVADQPAEGEMRGAEFLYGPADRQPGSPSRRSELMGGVTARTSHLRSQSVLDLEGKIEVHDVPGGPQLGEV